MRFEAVITKARFRRMHEDGPASVTMMCLHCHNECAKRRSIALNLRAVRTAMAHVSVELVAGDFNRASWRHKGDSVIDQVIANIMLPVSPGATPLWRAKDNSRRMTRRVRFQQATWYSEGNAHPQARSFFETDRELLGVFSRDQTCHFEILDSPESPQYTSPSPEKSPLQTKRSQETWPVAHTEPEQFHHHARLRALLELPCAFTSLPPRELATSLSPALPECAADVLSLNDEERLQSSWSRSVASANVEVHWTVVKVWVKDEMFMSFVNTSLERFRLEHVRPTSTFN